MRAGRPSKCTFSPAAVIQRRRCVVVAGRAPGSPCRWRRCRPGRRRAPPSGTGPCPRRRAGGCRRARSRGTRRRARSRRAAPRRGSSCRSRRPRRRHPGISTIACTCLAIEARARVGEAFRVGCRELMPFVDGDALRQVGERVVGAGLVGDDVDRDAAGQQLGEDRCRVADEADRERAALGLGGEHAGDGVVDVVGHLVEVARGRRDAAGGSRRRRR